VHLGIVPFHRASWGIIGASLRRRVTKAALEPQDFLYTLAVQWPGLLHVTEVFGENLPRIQSFRALLIGHLRSPLQRGALEMIRNLACRPS
jgi:mannitol-1-phosphate/altronate dehydrogenase